MFPWLDWLVGPFTALRGRPLLLLLLPAPVMFGHWDTELKYFYNNTEIFLTTEIFSKYTFL